MAIYQFGENIKIIFMALSAISELEAEKLCTRQFHKLQCMYTLRAFSLCIEIREVPLHVSLTCKSV